MSKTQRGRYELLARAGEKETATSNFLHCVTKRELYSSIETRKQSLFDVTESTRYRAIVHGSDSQVTQGIRIRCYALIR